MAVCIRPDQSVVRGGSAEVVVEDIINKNFLPVTAKRQKISGARPYFHDDDVPQVLARLEEIIRGGRLIFGQNTREFEESFRQYVGVEHAVSVSSCTAALEITMRFFGVQGREVIVPTNTFAACVAAIKYAGGIPVLADMDPETFCLETADVLSRINENTAGVIVVHIAGLIDPDIDGLREVCRERGLFLIEDPSHAHGASIDDRRAGSLADAACFSFYPTKVMTTGTGGMITTNNPDLAEYARSLRHHGQGKSLEQIVNFGSDWCMARSAPHWASFSCSDWKKMSRIEIAWSSGIDADCLRSIGSRRRFIPRTCATPITNFR